MKKIISVTLILALLSGTMAGCGADRADNANAADKTRNAEPDTGTEVNSSMNEQKSGSPAAVLFKTADPDGYAASEDSYAEDFYAAAVSAFLSGAGNENRICSPLNIYMALAMLAEITDGESRAQILTLLGEEDLETLRDTASERWTSNYRDDDYARNILASSLWLDEDIPFRQEAVDRLSEYYHASVHQGEMGSPQS